MEKGLTAQEAQQLQNEHGKNEITAEKKFSALATFLAQFPSAINAILFAAAILSFFISDVVDSLFIIAIILLNGIFGFVQEYNAEKSVEKLKSLVNPAARVIRDGQEIELPTKDLVPGDVVIISEGDRIPADGKLIMHHQMEIDESLLTGESLSVEKRQNDPVYSGTLLVKGSGKMRIETIGMQTKFGKIAETLAGIKPDKTPLQKKIDSLGKVLSVIIVIAALSLIPIGLLQHRELFPLILIAVSVGVAAIPEGLPAVITIALAIGTNRMAKRKAIVRKMPVIETLGAVQVVLVDKTGTLTQNAMRVKKVKLVKEEYKHHLLRASLLGNTASLLPKTNERFEIVGDKTDGALLLYIKEQVKNLDEMRKEGTLLEEYSFDPETKTVTNLWEYEGKRHVYVRGAPEMVLEHCKISEAEKEKITIEFDEYAKEGLRVIGFATKIEKSQERSSREHAEKNLEFVGFVGIYDPPRPEVHAAVEEAQKAGIQTVMVTGDNELTALTIAKEVGLIEKDEDVITSEKLEKMSDEELEKIIVHTRIFARATPEDKMRLVTTYRKLGYIVGVTGDGVNDALALKQSDVGIAMGESGTDVAKEASDIILLDDNFSTLVHAVEEGRTIYQNILTAVTYLLTGNLALMVLFFFATMLGLPSPLLPTQILWINLIMDGLPALALAADVKDIHVLHHPPRDSKAPFLTTDKLLFIGIVGIALGFSLFLTFNSLLSAFSENESRIFIFNMLIAFRLLMVFVVRRKSIFSANKLLTGTVVVTALIQLSINIIPFFDFLLQ